MKAREVCKVVVDDLEQRSHRFIRVNFANGDMVGHTGSLPAAVRAIEVVDECIGQIESAAREAGATLVITADHGNLDMMWEVDRTTGKVLTDDKGNPLMKTSHTLSPVPFCLTGAGADQFEVDPEVSEPGLGNIAATLLILLGFEPPPGYLPPLVRTVGSGGK
jgi:2,3-bisphosphoglycerate-independent phosphoglycerate mutase